MNPTGLLMIVVGVFVIARLVTTDSHGETLAGRLAHGQPGSQALTASTSSSYAPAGSPTISGTAQVTASQATGLVARTHSPAFARDVLKSLGAPQSAANISSLTAWIDREGNLPAVDQYNPLDTTLDMPGAVSTNPVGVKSYRSWAEGVTATAKTLAQGNFSAIAAQLKSGKGINFTPSVSQELESWSGGGYGSF